MHQAPAKDIEAAFQQSGEFKLKLFHFVVLSCFYLVSDDESFKMNVKKLYNLKDFKNGNVFFFKRKQNHFCFYFSFSDLPWLHCLWNPGSLKV